MWYYNHLLVRGRFIGTKQIGGRMASDREEIKAALEADRERKQRESEKQQGATEEGELENMREYIHVAMDEMENLRGELSAAKEANVEAQAEAEASFAAEKEKLNAKINAKWTPSSFWKWLSLIELLIFAVALMIIVIMKPSGNDTVIIEHYGNEAKIEKKETEVIKTRKLCDNLDQLASEFNKTDGGDYIMSVISIDGYEYLSLEGPNASVYYRNEFSLDSKDSGEVGVAAGNRTVYFPGDYDLTDPSSLVPVELKKKTGKGASLVFIKGGASQITGSMTFVDSDTLAVYKIDSFKEYLEELVDLKVLGSSNGISLSAVGKTYDYIIDSGTFNSLLYNDDLEPDMDADFVLSVQPGQLVWSTVLRIGDSIRLGRLGGTITAGEVLPKLDNVYFKAFAADESVTNGGMITAIEWIPEDYIEMIDATGRSFIVEKPVVVTPEASDETDLTAEGGEVNAASPEGGDENGQRQ